MLEFVFGLCIGYIAWFMYTRYKELIYSINALATGKINETIDYPLVAEFLQIPGTQERHNKTQLKHTIWKHFAIEVPKAIEQKC